MGGARELEKTICDVVRRALPEAPREISAALDLRRELGIDSIGLLAIIFAIEERLGVDMFQYAERLADAATLADLIAVAHDAAAAARPRAEVP